MAKAVGDKVTELDYNTLQSGINVIMGTPAGTTETNATGYNQSLASAQVSVGNSVTAAQWDNLRSDITKTYTHQFGSGPTITNVGDDDTVTATVHNQYETLVSTVSSDPNRYTVGAAQFSTVAGITGTKAAGWNGTETHMVSVTFTNANHRKSFFNAGGQIRIYVSNDKSSPDAKTQDWQHILNDGGQVFLNYKESARVAGTGSAAYYGTGSTDGNYNLTTAYKTIWTASGANPYSENNLAIAVKASASNVLQFRIRLSDADAGDQTGTGPAVDETVQGTTTSAVTYIRPTGANVSIPAPVFAAATGNTFA
jgi:hypothetical protein